MERKLETYILPPEFLKPGLLQSEYEVEVQVFEGCGGINLRFWFVCQAPESRSLQVEPPLDRVLCAEEIPHDDEPHLQPSAPHNQQSFFFLVTRETRNHYPNWLQGYENMPSSGLFRLA